MKPKEFFKRWYEGIKTLSPERQLAIKYIMQLGTTLSIGITGLVLLTTTYWYVGIILLFMTGSNYMELINIKQQMNNMKKLKEMGL